MISAASTHQYMRYAASRVNACHSVQRQGRRRYRRRHGHFSCHITVPFIQPPSAVGDPYIRNNIAQTTGTKPKSRVSRIDAFPFKLSKIANHPARDPFFIWHAILIDADRPWGYPQISFYLPVCFNVSFNFPCVWCRPP
ncbi:hypothetical protein D3C77_525100 [compost metagenome]